MISNTVAEYGIETPYGIAKQTYSQGAINAIDDVTGGAKLYRVGTLGQSQATEAQFWSLENPATITDINTFAQKFGIPAENLQSGNYFIEVGTLRNNTLFITRDRITSYNVCYTKLLRSFCLPNTITGESP